MPSIASNPEEKSEPSLGIAGADPRVSRSRWIVPALCIVFSMAMALASRGFLEPDEIMHFLYARAVWHDWRNLVNIWGRLGCTGLFALAVPGGIVAARLLAVGLTALTAHGAAKLYDGIAASRDILGSKGSWSFIARHATAFVWLLMFAQPCVALNSFTVMTEMPLACAWAWAAVLLLKGASWAGAGVLGASVLVGVGAWMRPEGGIAVALWPVVVCVWMRWGGGRRMGNRGGPQGMLSLMALGGAVAAGPLVAWYVLGTWAWRDWGWVVQSWPWAAASQYGRSGGIFMVSSLAALAVWMWVPVAAGAWVCWKGRRGGGGVGLILLVVPVAGFFALHGVLGFLGLFGSLSLPRYFVCVSPMVAVLGVLGLIRLEPQGGGRGIRFRSAVIGLAMVPLVALAAFGYLPMQRTSEERRLEVAVQAVVGRGSVESVPLIVGHPYAMLLLGLDPDSPAHVRVASRGAIAGAPAGTLLIADSTVWAYENRPTAEELMGWGYRVDEASAAVVDAVPERVEPLLFHPGIARVRLWVKQ